MGVLYSKMNFMKKYIIIFLTLLSFITNTYSQDTEKPDEIFTKPDPDFTITEIPDKWKNESAVIICQNLVYSFDKKGGKIIDKEIIRKRIKLLDKAAINEFSEFYFVSTENIGINIIKPDGKINKVNLSEAVVVSEEIQIPFVYRSNFRIKREYKKIAIPGLEVNDIIDYYYNFADKRSIPLSNEYVFPEILISLNNTYPTLKQKTEFQVEKGFNINFKNQNGAPDLKEKPSATPELTVFYFEDSDREKSLYERWNYIYRSTPTVKFQIVYIKNGDKSYYFIGAPGVPKKNLSDQEVLDKVMKLVLENNSFTTKVRSYLALILKDYRKDKKIKVVPPDITAKIAYYFYRHFRYYNPEGLGLGEQLINDGEDVQFVKTMVSVLKKYQVKYKVILVAPVEISDLSDVILKEELLWMIKIEEGPTPFYLYPPSLHTVLNEIPDSYAGAKAYQLHIDPKAPSISRTTLPKYNPELNAENTKLQVTPDSSDITNFKVKRKFTAIGNQKSYYQNLIYYLKIAEEEYQHYKNTVYPYYSTWGSTDAARRKEFDNNVKERMKSNVDDDYELVEYGDFSLDFYGRGYFHNTDSITSSDNNPFGYTDNFTIEGLLKKVGNNYIFEIGKLLGGQVEIEEKEMDRKFDIYYSPRTYKTEINFTIPEGYSLEGIDKLNMNVENETGFFKSVVSLNGSVLTIKTEKQYKNHMEKKEDWSKLVAFLNAAYDFTQTKVLLKKK